MSSVITNGSQMREIDKVKEKCQQQVEKLTKKHGRELEAKDRQIARLNSTRDKVTSSLVKRHSKATEKAEKKVNSLLNVLGAARDRQQDLAELLESFTDDTKASTVIKKVKALNDKLGKMVSKALPG